MLFFIGLGLYSEKGISVEGLEVARSADKVYIETYTSLMPNLSIKKLEEMIGKKIIVLRRADLEGKKSYDLIDEAYKLDVALLVPGDPFVATTHIHLRIEAEKKGIKTKVIHAASIVSAIAGETGLFSYKFGRSVTITFPFKGRVSETAYDVVKENLSRGLHTLLFLDMDVEKRRFMNIKEALNILLDIEEKRRENVITEDTLIVGLARIGGEDSVIKADLLGKLINYDFGEPPHTLIVPGKLHFIEAEALIVLAKAPESILHDM